MAEQLADPTPLPGKDSYSTSFVAGPGGAVEVAHFDGATPVATPPEGASDIVARPKPSKVIYGGDVTSLGDNAYPEAPGKPEGGFRMRIDNVVEAPTVRRPEQVPAGIPPLAEGSGAGEPTSWILSPEFLQGMLGLARRRAGEVVDAVAMANGVPPQAQAPAPRPAPAPPAPGSFKLDIGPV